MDRFANASFWSIDARLLAIAKKADGSKDLPPRIAPIEKSARYS
jgi:hypothetical protein